MYKAGAYPDGAIAPVEFLWQAPCPVPTTSSAQSNGKKMKLWIWCHPATEKQAQNELKSAVRSYNSASKDSVTVSRRNLVRFRLIGPRSHAVLMETLKPVWNSKNNFPYGSSREETNSQCHGCALVPKEESDSEDDISAEEGEPLPPAEKWWEAGNLPSQLAAHTEVLSDEYTVIKAASDPSQFGRGAVIGMCVQDPRLFTPSTKTDMVSSHYPQRKGIFTEKLEDGIVEGSDDFVPPEVLPLEQTFFSHLSTPLTSLPSAAAFSPIWDLSVCKSVSKSKFPDHILNRKRSEKFVKSSVLSLGDSAPQIPVLMIQQTPQVSADGPSLGAGWDLVLPPDWAMAFWVALVYRGARACAMKELELCDLESQVLHFPGDFPDTKAGQQHIATQRSKLEAEYLRKPPDKRPNYGSLLVPTPFHIAWDSLVRGWSKRCNEDESFGIARGTKRERGEEEFQVVPSCKKAKLDVNDSVSAELASVFGDPGEGISFKPGGQPNGDSTPPAVKSLGFYVLRSKQDLNSLKKFISSVLTAAKNSSRVCHGVQGANSNADFNAFIQSFAIDSLLEKHASALVAVKVEIHRAGTLNKLDILSLPSPSDLKSELATVRSTWLSKLPAKKASEEVMALGVVGKEEAVASIEQQSQHSGPREMMDRCGMTLVGKQGIVVGISSLSRSKMREMKRRKKGKKGSTFAEKLCAKYRTSFL